MISKNALLRNGFMKFLIVFLFFITCSFLFASYSESDNIIYVGEFIGERVNVRTGPHLNHTIIYKAVKGEKALALAEENGWVQIFLPTKANVWIHGDLVRRESETIGIVKKDSVNLRVKPSTQSFIMGQVDLGDELVIRGERFGWYKVQALKNLKGWVSQKYLKNKMIFSEYQETKRVESVKSIYREVEKIHNEEILKPIKERDHAFLIEKYKYIVDHFSEFPEATLAEHRLKEIQSWLLEKKWAQLEVLWKESIKNPEKGKDTSYFKVKYKNFIENFPKNIYTDIANQRLLFLNKTDSFSQNEILSMKSASEKVRLKGVVYDLGKLIGRPATHKLMFDGEIVCLLRSKNVKLADYVYRRVDMIGRMINVEGWDIPVLDVEEIKVYSWKGKF
ncbi:hypothetical protein AB834_05290 [PVC group bacterium (ex Bugula neritina AB1)]|nr:hypothetical protein AB834_05290 [PVC group bacterium (ex Bugula neritina AB1)]